MFILGAGASRQCGAPLMSDFLDMASDLLRSNQVMGKRVEFERVFEAIGKLQVVHSKAQLDLNNIESIFTVLELGKIIQKVPGLEPEDIPDVIAALKELIVKTLEVTVKFPVVEGRIHPPVPYQAFGHLLRHLYQDAFPRQTASVISFNYDIAADIAMQLDGLGPDYVLSKPQGVGDFVPLLKLHGSLNWAIEKETKEIRPLHVHTYLSGMRWYGDKPHGKTCLAIGSDLRAHFRKLKIEVESEPVIVPPSWNKADYHTALSQVWTAAATHLSEAEQIFIIGYSLPETDSFFRHLYALGSVGEAPLRRIAVFNPDKTTDERFRNLLGPGALARYEFHDMTFDKAIEHIKALFPKQS